MPSCSCTCADHDLLVQHALETFRLMSASVFNLPAKQDSNLNKSPFGLHQSFSAVSLVTNDIDKSFSFESDPSISHRLSVTSPPSLLSISPMSSFSSPSLTNLVGALSLPEKPSIPTTLKNTLRTNSSASSIHSQKVDDDQDNANCTSLSPNLIPVHPSAPNTTCSGCNQFCCHQRLFAHEQALTASALDVSNANSKATSPVIQIPSDYASSSNDTTNTTDSPLSNFNTDLAFGASSAFPVTHVNPMELAEALEFAGLSPIDTEKVEDSAKTRREDMEAVKKFLTSTAKTIKAKPSSDKASPDAARQYTTDIPEIFLHPDRVLSRITKSILVKEKQAVDQQSQPHGEKTGAKDEIDLEQEERKNTDNSELSSESDRSASSVGQSETASLDNSKASLENKQLKDNKEEASKPADNKPLEIKHTKPPPSPPILPAQLSTAFLNSIYSTHGAHGSLNNHASLKKSTTTLYELNSNNQNSNTLVNLGSPVSSMSLRPACVAPLSSSISTSTSAATFVSQSTSSSSTAIGSPYSSTASLGKAPFSALSPFRLSPSQHSGEDTVPHHHKYTESMLPKQLHLSQFASPTQHTELSLANNAAHSPDLGSLHELEQQYLFNPEPPKYMFTNLIDNEDPDALDNLPSHVTLNHLATSHMKNNVLAAACTSRYKTKYITQILYKPM